MVERCSVYERPGEMKGVTGNTRMNELLVHLLHMNYHIVRSELQAQTVKNPEA